MQLTNKTKGIVIVLVIVASIIVALPFLNNPPTTDSNSIEFTLLYNAGVIIEVGGTCIYIDPYNLTEDFTYPQADAILVTHGHRDHFDESAIEMLQTEDTVIVFPAIYSNYIDEYNGVGVNPEDQIQVGPFNITAFYMYESERQGITTVGHYRQNNYTSYIVEYNGFSFFHTGDANTAEEYDMITGQIDVGLFPLYWHYFYNLGSEIVNMTRAIMPRYFVPMHFLIEEDRDSFLLEYSEEIETIIEDEIVSLDYYETFTFEIET